MEKLNIFEESGRSNLLLHKYQIQRDLILDDTVLIEIFSAINPASIGDSILIRKLNLTNSQTEYYLSKILDFENGKIVY